MARMLFGPWEPDQPSFLSTGLQVCSNVYAGRGGYRPVGQFAALSGPLPSACLGASAFVSPSGFTSVLAGTSDALYQGFSASWSQIGAGYSLQSEDRWRFAQFGGLAIATNGVDPIVKIDLASALTAEPLGGSPPKAKLLAVVKDFLVGAVIDGSVNTLRWSGINDAEFWTIGTNQSDYQVMPAGGEITGLFGGEVGIILQRGRIARMTYVGDNLVFQFDEISNNVGCVSVHSTAQFGSLGFFLSDSGFMMWDGGGLKPIGQERVDRTFATLYTRADFHKMSTAIDARNNLVCWSMTDRIFVYNWVLDRWSLIIIAAERVFSGFSRSASLEEVSASYPNLDTMPLSLDDEGFKGGEPRFYLFRTDHVLGSCSGANMAAELVPGDAESFQGREGRHSMVRPLTDAAAGLTVEITSRARLGDAIVTNTYTDLRASGDVPVRESGRLGRIGLSLEAGAAWTFAQGIDTTPHPGARR